MASEYYRLMTLEIADFESLFLDFEFKPGGDYSKAELTKTAAYTLLAHSELEGYFESQIRSVIDSAEQLWRTDKKPCASLISMCSFGADKDKGLPEQKPNGDIWREPVFSSIARAKGKVTSNNGIRPHNIIPMLALIGYDVRTLDDDMLNGLDVLGRMRGAHAHNSSDIHLGQVFDPFDRKKKIQEVMKLVEAFDESYDRFKEAQFDPNFVPAKKDFLTRLKNLIWPS